MYHGILESKINFLYRLWQAIEYTNLFLLIPLTSAKPAKQESYSMQFWAQSNPGPAFPIPTQHIDIVGEDRRMDSGHRVLAPSPLPLL
jgi:hypothetical protein